MKIIKILTLSYIWGIILCNLIALLIWFKDPSTSPIDLPTVFLAILFSLGWPIALFGDFMASAGVSRKIMDLGIFIIPFILGFYSEKLLEKKYKK